MKIIIPVIVSFLCCAGVIPFAIMFFFRNILTVSDRTLKNRTAFFPGAGSFCFILAIYIAVFVYSRIFGNIPQKCLLPLIVAGCILFPAGMVSDTGRLPGQNLLFQVVAALVAVQCGYCFTRICFIPLPEAVAPFLTFFWILCVVNAFMALEGVSGGSLSVLMLVTLGIVFYQSAPSVAVVYFILAAAVCGFLVDNLASVKWVMGRGCWQFLGYLIAVLPLCESSGAVEYNKFLLMLVLLSILVIDLLGNVFFRMRKHKVPFIQNRLTIYYNFLEIGFSKRGTLCFLFVTQILVCVTVCLSLYSRELKGAILLCLSFIFMTILFWLIHFIRALV